MNDDDDDDDDIQVWVNHKNKCFIFVEFKCFVENVLLWTEGVGDGVTYNALHTADLFIYLFIPHSAVGI